MMIHFLSMKNKHVIDVYNQIAEEYSRRYDPIESDEDLVFLNTFLKHVKRHSHIVDLGCGTGYSAGYFAQHGMTAEGVDLSSNMIYICRRNYPGIPFAHESMVTYEPKEFVDAVWAGYSLFHLEQPDFEKTLKNLRTYLKPGGVFGLVMQEGEGELDADEPLLPGESTYVHLYTENELRGLLGKYGFEVVETKRKQPMYEMEFPYNKLLFIAK